jgi:hypothetical protein
MEPKQNKTDQNEDQQSKKDKSRGKQSKTKLNRVKTKLASKVVNFYSTQKSETSCFTISRNNQASLFVSDNVKLVSVLSI